MGNTQTQTIDERNSRSYIEFNLKYAAESNPPDNVSIRELTIRAENLLCEYIISDNMTEAVEFMNMVEKYNTREWVVEHAAKRWYDVAVRHDRRFMQAYLKVMYLDNSAEQIEKLQTRVYELEAQFNPDIKMAPTLRAKKIESGEMTATRIEQLEAAVSELRAELRASLK